MIDLGGSGLLSWKRLRGGWGENPFRVGDKVLLKSGSPWLRVVEVRAGEVVVRWRSVGEWLEERLAWWMLRLVAANDE